MQLHIDEIREELDAYGIHTVESTVQKNSLYFLTGPLEGTHVKIQDITGNPEEFFNVAIGPTA